jgi:hypothetical protein
LVRHLVRKRGEKFHREAQRIVSRNADHTGVVRRREFSLLFFDEFAEKTCVESNDPRLVPAALPDA